MYVGRAVGFGVGFAVGRAVGFGVGAGVGQTRVPPAYSEPANASGPEPACAPGAAYTAAPAPAYAKDTNGFAIAAFICAFFVPIAGIALSIIAMIQANSNVYAKPLKGLSIWALVISIIGIIVRIALLVAFLSLFSGFFSSLYEYINRLLNGAVPTMIGM